MGSDKGGSTRSERDSFGPIDVPADHHWGAQTARSLQFFAIGEEEMPQRLIHALALVRSGEAGKLISAQSTRTTGSALVSGDTHSDPSTPTSLDAPRRSISSSTVDSIDDSDSDSDGEDATSRKRDEELARCLLGSAVGGGAIAARGFDVVEAPVDSELGATGRFITAVR